MDINNVYRIVLINVNIVCWEFARRHKIARSRRCVYVILNFIFVTDSSLQVWQNRICQCEIKGQGYFCLCDCMYNYLCGSIRF